MCASSSLLFLSVCCFCVTPAVFCEHADICSVCVCVCLCLPIYAHCMHACERRSTLTWWHTCVVRACFEVFVCVCLRVSWCVLIGGSSRSMSLTGWITVISHYWLPISVLHTPLLVAPSPCPLLLALSLSLLLFSIFNLSCSASLS